MRVRIVQLLMSCSLIYLLAAHVAGRGPPHQGWGHIPAKKKSSPAHVNAEILQQRGLLELRGEQPCPAMPGPCIAACQRRDYAVCGVDDRFHASCTAFATCAVSVSPSVPHRPHRAPSRRGRSLMRMVPQAKWVVIRLAELLDWECRHNGCAWSAGSVPLG